MNVFDLTIECAKIPSFSSYEERLHPFIEEIVQQATDAKLERVPDNNIIIKAPGKANAPIVALTAHLDKINHCWSANFDGILPARIEGEKIIGQLDDAVGVGICLDMLLKSREREFPPLYILFSEMEEKGSHIGAERIADHLLKEKQMPAVFITIDTTPMVRKGIALYSKHWEKNGINPSSELIAKTVKIEQYFESLNPSLKFTNNSNDYLVYGERFSQYDLPSVALEPAICPYHEPDEEVFCDDIKKTAEMLESFLICWGQTRMSPA